MQFEFSKIAKNYGKEGWVECPVTHPIYLSIHLVSIYLSISVSPGRNVSTPGAVKIPQLSPSGFLGSRYTMEQDELNMLKQ